MGTKSVSRYEIRSELGRGGSGIVYEAYDPQQRTTVALKTLESAVAENVYRLKREFRALADVHHPNLVRLGELACDRDQWFFTMEVVRGKYFTEYVRAGDDAPHAAIRHAELDTRTAPLDSVTIARDSDAGRAGLPASANGTAAASAPPEPARVLVRESGPLPFDEARLRSALAQLVSATASIHGAGQAHCDLKPSNVLVTDRGRVVLLDFGLIATLAPRLPRPDDFAPMGTPAFMAPEQAAGDAVGPAADWYAIGSMLFLALTGSLPFEGRVSEMLKAKLSREAPPPTSLVAGLPEDLASLCVALLARDPEKRPRHPEICARLGLRVGDSVNVPSNSPDASGPFVGRAVELIALEDALARVVRERRGRLVLVDGEAGVGKSFLVHKFLGTLGSDTLVLTGRCYEQESVPFKGVDSIVDTISEYLITQSDAAVERLVGAGVRYLATLFPVLRRVPYIEEHIAPIREVTDPHALRAQAFREFERLIGALAAKNDLVLFIDDLQWADQGSLELLGRTVLGPHGAPCLFVATMRTAGDAPATPAHVELLASAERVRLGGLSDRESHALMDSLWTTLTTSPVRRESLVREARGHPLFLGELIRSARSGQQGDEEPHNLEQAIWQRILDRDAIDREFLEMVAIAGAPIAYEVIAHANEVDVGECHARLAGLRAAQLIRVGRRGADRTVEPYHDRIRESILLNITRVPGAEVALVERHLRLARALLARTPREALDARIFGIVAHLNAGRALLGSRAEHIEAAQLNLRASANARQSTAYAAARDLARMGLTLVGEAGWEDAYDVTRALQTQLMASEVFVGDAVAARAAFERARAHVTRSSDRTDLYVSWIGLETSAGHLAEAIEAGRERLAELGAPMPKHVTKLSVLAQYVVCRVLQGRRQTHELLHLPALDDPHREGVLKLMVAMSPAAFFLDTNVLAWLQLEAVAISMRYGVSDVSSYGFGVYGTVISGVFKKHKEGEEFGRLALALNERFKNERLAARLHFLYGGWHACSVRPFRDAKQFLMTSHELARAHADMTYEAYAASVHALVAYSEATDLPSLEQTSSWAREVGERRKEDDMAAFADIFTRFCVTLRSSAAPAADASGARAPADLGREGRPDEELRTSLTEAKTPSALYYYFFCNAELAYLFGDHARAEALLDEALRRRQIVFGLPTGIELVFLEALVAAKRHDTAPWSARGGRRRAVGRAVSELRVFARSCPENFEAHYLIACAEHDRVRGASRDAGSNFERAIAAARAHHTKKREALALELGSAHAAAQGDTARATAWRREAVDAYRAWGADRKAIALSERA